MNLPNYQEFLKRDKELDKIKEKIVKIFIEENLTISDVESILRKIISTIDEENSFNEHEFKQKSYSSLVAKK